MKQLAYGITDKGKKRKNNEDSFLLNSSKKLFIVADGMGGHSAGEVASMNAVKLVDQYLTPEILSEISSHPEMIEIELTNSVCEAHKFILSTAKKNKDYHGMGTTIVIALILNNVLHICHVGDSRAYAVNADSIKQLTNDHSHVGELVRSGKMTPEEARQSNLKNQITQALGSPYSIKPEYNSYSIDEDNSILLCSDGLWDMLPDEEIQETVMTDKSLQEICVDLVNKANQAGGKDNITLILIDHFRETTTGTIILNKQ